METLHALDVLTEDCWREVFKEAWSPADLKSCSETCTTFEGILERKRNSWLFHAILPHIFKHLSAPLGPGANWRRQRLGGNWDAMNTCRRVCKGWHQGIDNYLETHNNYFQGNFHLPAYGFWVPFRDGPRQFQEKFEDCTSNPFIGRCISIDSTGGLLNPPEIAENGWQDNFSLNVHRMLTRFGNEIWSVYVNDISWFGNLSYCKNIQVLLGMLPNLKSLQLCPNYSAHQGYRMNELPAFLAANPLPDHPNLENLVLDDLNLKMARPLLAKYGPQLKRLRLHNTKPFKEKARLFQCLKELEIKCRSVTDELLNGLRNLRSPLNILHIHVLMDTDSKIWPIDELIRNVLHLPVTDLKIVSGNYFERKLTSFPTSLRHDSVRRVRITSWTEGSISCNFLRCFPNLEEVHFINPRGIPKPIGYRNNILVVTSNKEDMYDSGIWDILPHLQLITVKFPFWEPRIYRRSTLEMRRLEETMKIMADVF